MAIFSVRSALLSGASILTATAVMAQDAESDDFLDLGSIEIFGDRSASTLDQSDASVAVLTEDRLDTPTTQDVEDAFRQIVNASDGDFTESGFVIRGINSEGLTPGGAGAPLASFYIDGVQQTAEAARRGARGLFDAEQFEVYRGPQSTLSGRNALAGAIYLRTKDPEFERSGAAQITYGENNRIQAGLAYGDRISDNLAFRLSGEWSQKDSDLNFPSYSQYPGTGDLTEDQYYTVRGKLLWLPTYSDDTQVLFSYGHSYDSPDTNLIAGPNWNPTTGVTFEDDRGDIYGSLTPLTFFPFSPLPLFQDVRETKVDNAGLNITHNFNQNLTLTAFTGFSDSRTERQSINFGNNAPIFDPTAPFGLNTEAWYIDGAFDQRILSQEVRLNYESDGLRWVGGIYLANEKNDANQERFALNTSTFMLETLNATATSDIDNYALFGEVTYDIAQGWSVIAGGRVDYYKQTQNSTITTVDFATGATNTSTSSSTFSETAFIPKIGFGYEINANNSLFLIYQEGYRPGGSGVQLNTGNTFEYDSEDAKNIELTYRGDLMGGRLSIGASIFYQDWDNQQVEVWEIPFDPTSSQIVNAGESESYGGEIDLIYEATDMLDLYASVGLLNTEFKDFVLSTSAGDQNFSGQPFSNAPEQNIVIGFRWGDTLGWFTGANVQYTGSSFSRIEPGLTRAELPSYTTVDAQVGYAWENATLTAYATNLFDERYFTYNSGPDSLAALGERREIGIRLNASF